MIKNKLKASFYHLLISFILIAIIMAAVILIWFPTPFLGVTRFKEVALILVAVDLILGPLLTFVVFNKNKKSLPFDLSVIASIQITALAYGLFTLYQSHPVYITYNIDRFTLVNARDARHENAKFSEYKVSKLSSPIFAFVTLPEDNKKRNELIDEVLQGKPDLDQRTEYYEPYDSHLDEILSKGLDPESIFSEKKNNKLITKFKNQHGENINKYAYFALEGSTKDIIWVLDKKTGKPVDSINVNPWSFTRKTVKEKTL